MLIAITDDHQVEVTEREDLNRLAVNAGGHSMEDVVRALISAGSGTGSDADHVNLSIDALRAYALDGAPQPNERAFNAMIAYAVAQGWVHGESVRAHVVNLAAVL
ncbi:hypothetical protein [Paenarthrobacter nitroguajacolicus]|uniref:hypothetical protein n=1 Tax=Paenarthrobacter nitroguajacolicus TaxID=211146 RepID=UPI000A4EA0AC|nr:hypothetical protein [Paenarthrobacter nitroguajacolicus]